VPALPPRLPLPALQICLDPLAPQVQQQLEDMPPLKEVSTG